MLIDHVVGRYPVGATTLSFSIGSTRQFGSSELNTSGLNGPGPAVTLSEIAFSLYYPTLSDLPESKRGIDWQLRPIHASLDGAAHYSGIPYWKLFPLFYLYNSRLKIPVYANAPLLPPQDGSTTWPLVFFSHGLSGSRNSYSHMCSRIASSGKVVVIMEHRDGTGIACFPKSPETGIPTPKYYVKPLDTTYGEARQSEFRMDQLALRRFEIYQAHKALKYLVTNGNRGGLETIDGSTIDWTFLNSKVNFDCVQLVGHSFGGATIYSLLSNPPPEGFEALRVSHAVLLDPWLEPFSPADPVITVNNRGVKMIIINSEEFTLWKTHFARLQRIAKDWNDTQIYTILRSIHVHFSDPHAYNSESNAVAGKIIRIIGDLTLAFLDDSSVQCLAKYPTRKMVFERVKATPSSKPKGRLMGEFGDIVIHDSVQSLPARNERVLTARL